MPGVKTSSLFLVSAIAGCGSHGGRPYWTTDESAMAAIRSAVVSKIVSQ